MADVTEGRSSQSDEISTTDRPIDGGGSSAEACASTNGDLKGGKDGCFSGSVVSSSTSKPRSFFPLRSSLLSSNSSSSSAPSSSQSKSSASKAFVLNPPRLSNPFAKVEKTEEDDEPRQSDVTSTPAPSGSNAEPEVDKSASKSSVSFVPLGVDSKVTAQVPSSTTSTAQPLGFVFGQNIHEKVVEAAPVSTVAETSSTSTETKENTAPAEEQDAAVATTNGATAAEMLFTAHVKKDTDKADSSQDSGGKTLSEAAREYEEARAVKRKFEEVQVITGEEEESNVLQINCKLFSWSSSSWVERGRGTLRVNDFPSNPTHHRLIVRSAGSLRVVLNTNIWSGMTIDRASDKSMRITAMDSNGVVKVFLIMASPKEMDQLKKCLEWRVNNLKKNEPTNKKTKEQSEDLPSPIGDKICPL